MRQPRNINLVRDSTVPINHFQSFECLQPFTCGQKKIYVNDLEDQCGQKTFYAFTNVNDRKRIRVDRALNEAPRYNIVSMAFL